jgi:hypothetical protein
VVHFIIRWTPESRSGGNCFEQFEAFEIPSRTEILPDLGFQGILVVEVLREGYKIRKVFG